MSNLIDKATQLAGSNPAAITVRHDEAAPVEVSGPGGRLLFLDAYTGELRGEGAKSVRSFFRSVTDWHRRLAATGEHRDTGRAITGASNLLFGVLALSGLILWAPRKWSWRHIRPVFWFRGGMSGKARDFNWHNVIGFWCAIPLIGVVLGALVISYPWATNLVYKVTGTEPPRQAARPEQPRTAGTPAPVSLEGIDSAWTAAERQVPGWQVISFRIPQRAADPWAFTVDLVDRRGRPDQRHLLTIDPKTAQIVKTESFEDYNAGRKARTWLRWIHTGEAGGIAGQTIAGIASFGGAVLVWTGFALALRRFRAWRSRKTSGGRESLVNSDLRDVSQPTV